MKIDKCSEKSITIQIVLKKINTLNLSVTDHTKTTGKNAILTFVIISVYLKSNKIQHSPSVHHTPEHPT